MEVNDIKVLAELMKKNDLIRIELEDGKNKIKMERQSAAGCFQTAAALAPMPAEIVAAGNAELLSGSSGVIPAAEQGSEPASLFHEIKAPMVGVFYASKAPGEAPFVQEGASVAKGDTLCIIEAMKPMNDIVSDCAGTVAEVCAENGEIVNYGQVLFKIRQ